MNLPTLSSAMPTDFDDEALLPISALQHYRFCNRRVALVHIEGLWAENQFTAEGNQLHKKAHDASRGESRPGQRVERGMMLRTRRLMLYGKADVAEFHLDQGRITAATLIEYKRGRPKPSRDLEFKIQLCAQAIALEEALPGIPVAAALYFGQTRKREAVALDQTLRDLTTDTARQLHELIASRVTPTARHERRKCERCSMKPLCMPTALRTRATAARYLEQVIQNAAGADCSDSLWS
ncbi:MAG: CRISPR-associated protein Cas4 [Tepidisphaeraceae bacterium]